ncbi:MAG TPA: WG repeat-containing protein [Spirochaetota bacterium]|nr:WG repeat-containing protein [Spirochaetota bacterium]
MNNRGAFVIKPAFHDARNFKNGRAAVKTPDSDGKFGFIAHP